MSRSPTRVPNPSRSRSRIDRSGRADLSENLSAIHGNFIPLSSPERTDLASSPKPPTSPIRDRSPSPRCVQDQSVHLHLSLTDSQMEKLTSAFTGSPPPKSQRRGLARLDNPQLSRGRLGESAVDPKPHFKNPFVTQGNGYNRGRHQQESRDRERERVNRSPVRGLLVPRSHSDSPSKRSRSPAKHGRRIPNSSTSNSAPSIAERRQAPLPRPIDIQLAQSLSPVTRIGIACANINPNPFESPSDASYPVTPVRGRSRRVAAPVSPEDSSSVYSDDEQYVDELPHISPLHIAKPAELQAEVDPERRPSVLQDYAAWADANARGQNMEGVRGPPPVLSEREARDNENLRTPTRRDVFSPLAPFYNGGEYPAAGKGRKVMVGTNGWLERTGKTPEKKQIAMKKGGFLDALKRMAKEVADVTDLKAARRAKEAERDRRTSRLKVTLDPREQSLLYCELEFLLTSALDSYINGQFNAGRLDADKYKKIADLWQQKGRPKVVGFRYDLETQLELVHLHLHEFKFYGDRAGVPAAAAGALEMMKVNARAMRIRTFCQPDSVVAKQLLDSQGLLNLLGCSEPRQIQLAEVIQFFKTVLEREKHFRKESGGGVGAGADASAGAAGGGVKTSTTGKSLSGRDQAGNGSRERVGDHSTMSTRTSY